LLGRNKINYFLGFCNPPEIGGGEESDLLNN